MSVPRLALRSDELMASLAAFHPETITVYALTEGAIDAYGTPARTLTARAGLSNVAAAAGSVKSGKTIQTQRERLGFMARSQVWYRLQIAGAHDEITDSDIVGWKGLEWRVSAISIDPTATVTQLLVEYVEPSGV